MRIVVTGAAGFIGSHVCEQLTSRGDDVVGLDNFDPFYSRSDKERNLEEPRKCPLFRLVEGDIRDSKLLDDIFSRSGGVDAVIHLAALAGVQQSLLEPLRYYDVNVNGTQVILEAMRRHGVRKMVFASSSSVYGNCPVVPFREDAVVDFPISHYAATKKAGEVMAYAYHHLYGISVHCLRFFTVYGPRQRPDLAIHKFARLMLDGKPVPVYGDGSFSRDFTFVSDIVTGVLASLDCVSGYKIYNLGSNHPVSVNQLVDMLGKVLGVRPHVNHLPAQSGDVERTWAEIIQAISELNYQPRVDLKIGLREFVTWLRDSLSVSVVH